jgi:hypothetical protein
MEELKIAQDKLDTISQNLQTQLTVDQAHSESKAL